MDEIYLDNRHYRPLDQVVELMAKIQKEVYGNPSSLHRKGMEAERVLKEARATLAELLQVRQEEIFFTSGGTESNNLAIKGAAYRRRRRGGHIVTTRIEHPSVLNARQLKRRLPATHLTGPQGYIDFQELEQAITEETIWSAYSRQQRTDPAAGGANRRLVKSAIPTSIFTWTGSSLLERYR